MSESYQIIVHVYTGDQSATGHINLEYKRTDSNGNVTSTYYGSNVGGVLNGIRDETDLYSSRTDKMSTVYEVDQSTFQQSVQRAQDMAEDDDRGYGLLENCLDFVREMLEGAGLPSEMSEYTEGGKEALHYYAMTTDFLRENGGEPVLNLMGDICEDVGSAAQYLLDSALDAGNLLMQGDLLGAAEAMVMGFAETVGMLAENLIDAIGDFVKSLRGVSETLDPSINPPLVIDLDGDGVHLLSFTEADVQFTLESGEVIDMGWASAGDGILVHDANGNGRADGLAEINLTSLSPGAKTDLEALAALDDNLDGLFDASDAAFDRFLVWRDANSDGVSDAGETMTLAQAGIESIALSLNGRSFVSAGNLVSNTTTVTMSDGSQREAFDVGFFGVDATSAATAAQAANQQAIAADYLLAA